MTVFVLQGHKYFIQQQCIQLLKSDSKDIYNIINEFCFN